MCGDIDAAEGNQLNHAYGSCKVEQMMTRADMRLLFPRYSGKQDSEEERDADDARYANFGRGPEPVALLMADVVFGNGGIPDLGESRFKVAKSGA